jgi:PTS system nitrogen regulatory IIA component
MDLKIEDVAVLLNVSESTIKRWILDKKFPTYRINQDYRFSRTEVENWVILYKPTKLESPTEEPHISSDKIKGGSKQYSLFRALHKGDVIPLMPGRTKEEVIRVTMRKVAKDLHVDAEIMADLLLDRESLMPTALSHGIGVPHTRDSLLHVHYDVVFVVFPQEPLEYGALDGKPVHTLFFLFACEDKRHLHLLAKIAHLSSQPEAIEFLQSQPSKNQLLNYIKQWESQIPIIIR